MTLEIIPEKLFTMHNVKPLVHQNNAVIFHKILHKNLLDKEIYLSQSAIIFLVKGSQILHQSSGENIKANQGDLLFLAKDLYSVSDYTTQNNQFEAVLFFITDEIIDRLRPKNPISSEHVQTYSTTPQITKFMASLVDIYANQPNVEQILEPKLQELLALIGQTSSGVGFLNNFYKSTLGRKRDIRQFMKDNYLKNLKVDDYATLTGHSKSTFTREFKKLYGATPHQWLIEQRLIKAHNILTENSSSVLQTALAVGYENVSHFATAYKNKYKQSPSQTKNINAQV